MEWKKEKRRGGGGPKSWAAALEDPVCRRASLGQQIGWVHAPSKVILCASNPSVKDTRPHSYAQLEN